MNLTNPAELRALLERHGFNPQKKWGQHFLISSRVVDAIIGRLEGISGILEVGPGPGVLTSPASELAHLIALEVDPIAVSALSESAPKARVIHGDALELDIRPFLESLPTPRAVLSNMPYNITGPLLDRFSRTSDLWKKAVLMMQREVGDRILAPVGSSEFSSLSVSMQTRFEISKVCSVPPGAFFPPPKVESIVLELTPRQHGLSDEFFAFVRTAFTQPRKTLANNLSSGGFSRERLAQVLGDLRLAESVRPHQIGLDQWQILWEALQH
ncbi:MAG: 16S rRNA (adenine(1518)-N(6)/adenine(1519)-N(6))-dimethyltransferase RsmA [Fimbriimonadaceae bacterium]|nr:16S rRNA (adenine(1518)-N(6)/adenine(1519)-N(6))-dimethyltransferase RsmA [Fimbriimonadaceae bacterium]